MCIACPFLTHAGVPGIDEYTHIIYAKCTVEIGEAGEVLTFTP